MTDTITTSDGDTELKVERPRLFKVMLVNDDFTPRDFVVMVLKAEFRMGAERAQQIMSTAHQRGVCVVAVFTKDVAETQGDRGDRCRAQEGLSAAVHHRARGIAPPFSRSGAGVPPPPPCRPRARSS